MGRLFAVVVAVIALVSAAIFALHIWWLPPDISVHGGGIDRQLNETMVVAGVLFVLAQLALAAFVWRAGEKQQPRPVKVFPGGATPMVVVATVLVGFEILVLTFVGSKLWAGVYQTLPAPGSLQIEVQAEQFAFYFRYAGKDGKFGGMHPGRSAHPAADAREGRQSFLLRAGAAHPAGLRAWHGDSAAFHGDDPWEVRAGMYAAVRAGAL